MSSSEEYLENLLQSMMNGKVATPDSFKIGSSKDGLISISLKIASISDSSRPGSSNKPISSKPSSYL